MTTKSKGTAKSKSGPKGKRARKPIPAHIKAAADRAEARAKGKPLDKPKKPIDPKIKKLAAPVVAPEHYKPKDEPKADSAKMGRPTKYKDDFVKVAEAMCKLGATDADLADAFGCDIRTVQRWRVQHEDFCRATEIGKAEADDAIERSLYHRAIGYTHDAEKIFNNHGEIVRASYREHVPPDTAAAIYWLNNRRGDKWRQMSRHEHTGKDGGPIEIDQTGDIEQARRVAFALGRALERERMKVIEG